MAATTVYLHIGLPKSGTTYLQNLVHRNREALLQQGLCIPGRPRDHIRAGHEVQRGPGAAQDVAGLIGEIERSGAPAGLISMETLVRAGPRQIDRLVGRQARGHEVRVLVTARSLDRSVPAQWQESTQFGGTWSYAEYLSGVTAEDPYQTPAGRSFWDQHDLPAIVSRWAAALGAERVRVVTLPPQGPPELLWRRVAASLGLDPEADLVAPPGTNESLGSASAHLMLRVNEALASSGSALTTRDYGRVVRRTLAKQVLSGRSAQEGRLTLPPGLLSWARSCSEEMVTRLDHTGVGVVGDLEDLVPGRAAVAGAAVDAGAVQPGTPTEAEMLEAAVDGLVGLVHAQARQRRRASGGGLPGPGRGAGQLQFRRHPPSRMARSAVRRLLARTRPRPG